MANLELSNVSKTVGDDGGYLLYIIGDYLTNKTITNEDAPIKVKLRNSSSLAYTDYLYSTNAGEGVLCTIEKNEYIVCSTPILEPAIYHVIIEWGESSSFTISSGLMVKRRVRYLEQYELRASMPPLYKTGERLLNQDTFFLSTDNSIDTTEQGAIQSITSAIGYDLGLLKGKARTIVTEEKIVTAIIGSSETSTIKVESSLNLSPNDFIFVGGVKCLVKSISLNNINIQTENPFFKAMKGTEVVHATFTN